MSDQTHLFQIVWPGDKPVRKGSFAGSRDEATRHVAAELETEPLNTWAVIAHPDGSTTRLTKMIAVEWFAPSPDEGDDEWDQGPHQRKEE